MASSNRHWPSLFRSKPCNDNHQWQHDINSSLLSSGCHRTPYASPGCEERTPEPKPRWNPKPEQIRILEAIFESGMVNPPRDEIRKIRAQLQEYGQVGDANVFYWFQNRKSRNKNKLRHLQNSKQQKQTTNKTVNSTVTASPAVAHTVHSTPMSFTSFDKSSSSTITSRSSEITALSLDAIINQADYFPATVSATGDQFLSELPMLFPSQQGFCFSSHPPRAINQTTVSEQAGVVEGPCSNLFLSELLGQEKVQGREKAKMTSLLGYHSLIGGVSDDVASLSAGVSTPAASTAATTVALSLPVENNLVQGVPVGLVTNVSVGKSTVFVNGIAFRVPSGPLNIREAFGDDVVLINSAGELVVTDQWGITLQSLQHGAFYYLI